MYECLFNGTRYFTVHNVPPSVLPTRVSALIPLYNVHPYFSLRNLGKKCAQYKAKYGTDYKAQKKKERKNRELFSK